MKKAALKDSSMPSIIASGLGEPVMNSAVSFSSSGIMLHIVECESFTTMLLGLQAFSMPSMAAFTSPVIKCLALSCSLPSMRVCSGLTIPLMPSRSADMKIFKHGTLFLGLV